MTQDIEKLKHEVQKYKDKLGSFSLTPENTLQNVQQFVIKLLQDIKECKVNYLELFMEEEHYFFHLLTYIYIQQCIHLYY